MTEQSEHLSSAQIENYGNRTSGAGPEAAQRDEHQRLDHQGSDDQRVNDQRIDDRQINDQGIHDRKIDDLKISDLKINDQQMNDQHVEAHLADCASCRNRLLEFHRSLFASPANLLEPDKPKADQLKNDPSEHDTSLSGHSLSGHSSSGPSSSQRPPDSRLDGVSPTGSALADSKFANPKYPVQAQVRTAPTPECPSDDALRELAAGLTPDDVAAKLAQHAATCNHCGPLLRTYTEIFSDDFTPKEQAALANLQSSSAEWQKNTARQMLEAAGETTATKTSADAADTSAANKQSSQQKSFKGLTTTTSGGRPFFWKWALVPAAAAAITFAIYYAQRVTPEKIEQQLAQASTEQRTIEMRWPGAKWGPMRVVRGKMDIRLPRPQSLLDAEATISQQGETNSVAWLRLKAETEMLEWEPEQAISLLQRALNQEPHSVLLMMDLAMAHFQEGEKTAQTSAYKNAVDAFTRILEIEPLNTTALFNRGIAYERLKMFDAAIADWKAFVEHEKDPLWQEEGRNHIALAGAGENVR